MVGFLFQLCHLFLLTYSAQAHSQAQVGFDDFLKVYQSKSARALGAEQALTRAENTKIRDSDLWRSRLTATPQIEFFDRNFQSASGQDIGFRSQSVSGSFTQQMPTGTNLELNGLKFLEVQNPLFASVDRRYSARITQDLFRNAFGEAQRAQRKRAEETYSAAELQYRQDLVASCQEAFELYTDTYVQQEVVRLQEEQLRDANRALQIARRLHRDRLINDIDKLSSESDFLNTQLQTEQARQRLENNRRQMAAFFEDRNLSSAALSAPVDLLRNRMNWQTDKPTLSELLAQQRVIAQEYELDRVRSDRWADVRLGLEAGEAVGRFGFGGSLLAYNETFLLATLTLGFDLIHKTEDSDLKTAIEVKNNLTQQKQMAQRTQRSLVENLISLDQLLQNQIKTSERQVQLLEEKARVAFQQMGRARLDFENYLLHRNAYRDRKINDLNLKRDYWLNLFSLHREYAHEHPQFCKASS